MKCAASHRERELGSSLCSAGRKNDQTNLTLNLAHPDILPMWFAPSVLNRKYELMKTCEKNFECPICFFDLPLAPASGAVGSGRTSVYGTIS